MGFVFAGSLCECIFTGDKRLSILQQKNDICSIIVVYNGYDCLRTTVGSIITQVGGIVLIDNNSDEETLNLINDLVHEYSSISVIYNKDNLGIAVAFNQGVNYAKMNGFQFFLTLDQDSTSAPNMVEEMLKVYEEYGNDPLASLCPRVIYDCRDGAARNEGNTMNWRTRLVAISSGHLVSINLFDCVGEYNEDLFIDSVDFDYCLRIQITKGRLIECESALLYQQLGDTLLFSILGLKYKYSMHSPIRNYYMTRNHIYIMKNYLKVFPIFCIKKQIGMIIEIFKVIIFHPERRETIHFIVLGIKHGFQDYLGKIVK